MVFSGHSQGAFLLERLIADQLRKDPAFRNYLVLAILAGENVLVPPGRLEGGTFPTSRSARGVVKQAA